ncbi:MAG: hypothetical protein ABIM21_07910 [candidate division WOR-3 bacterium]
MISRELLELKKVLEEERSALINGAVEEILKWASHKIRLLHLLKDKDLTPEEIELLKELRLKNERNRELIEAGLNFIDEAYRLINQFLLSGEAYSPRANAKEPKLFSGRA